MFDKSEIFAETILPKITELRSLCFTNQIPMFITCATSDDGQKTIYSNDMVSPADADIRLSKDRIADMVKMLNGFTAVPEEKPQELEFEFDVRDDQ